MNTDDQTPPAGAPPIETLNKFMVGSLENTITILGLTPRRLTHDEALNLAAWLLAIADSHSGQHVDMNGAVLSLEFLELLHSVQNT
jgi:hypothetical protein